MPAHPHQARVLEDSEVVGDERLADAQVLDEMADTKLLSGQSAAYVEARWVGQCSQSWVIEGDFDSVQHGGPTI